MRSKTVQELLDKMEKDPWWVKLKRWLSVEIHVIKCLGVVKYFKPYYPFWLGILVWIALNGFEIIREAPSIGMLIMYLLGYFKTKLLCIVE